MKKAMVLCTTFYNLVHGAHVKFRANYMLHCLVESRNLATCRIKGIWKLAMTRYYA